MSKMALIVEDEIFVALDIERILTDAGYEVCGIAADQQSALEAARGCSFAFVDVNLRDGPSGPAIAHAIARDHKDMKVVFVTANPAQIAGAPSIGFVRKPFSARAIRAAASLASGEQPPLTDDGLVLNAA